MGKKSSPAAPAAPDPVATAAAQSTANKEAAVAQANLNRIDQYTPQGSITYNQTGTNADGTPKYAQTQSYSPEQQKLYNQENQISSALGGLATNNIQRVADAQSKPFSFDGMTPLQTGVGSNLPGIQYGSGPNAVQSSTGNSGNIQKGLDYSGATALPGTGDFSADAKRVADSVYNQAASRLDPQYQQAQSDQEAKLAAQGISTNSDAYRRDTDNLARQKTDAYNQATYSAQQAGANEQSRIFGLALQARQQGVNETNSQGQFANSAQDQQYQQNLANAGLFNEANQQQFQQGQQATATGNTAQNQAFNQQLTNANLNNTGRQQQIEESSYLRNLPLNDIAALLGTGGTVQNPSFSNVSQVGVAAPDYQGAVYANYNAANQQYQAAQQARSQGLGSIFGTLGSIGGAAIMASDRRLKERVMDISRLASGLRTYVFSYVGDTCRHYGVMADEVQKVIPEAVITLPSGYLAVDYRKVW